MEPEVIATEPSPPPAPPKRRRWPWILGIVVGVLVLVGGGGYFAVTKAMHAIEQNGAPVAEAILGPLRDGQKERLWQEAAPEFRSQVKQEQWNTFLNTVDQTVGRPVSWKLTGAGTRAYVGTSGTERSTTYSYDVTCEKGNAAVDITVNGDRRLLYLNFRFK